MNNKLSILEQEYKEPDRPYSQNELKYIRDRNFRSLRIGSVRAAHKDCGHFYYVKENGRKEKEITEKKCEDSGNCSVCWKFNKTPRHLKNTANNMINTYSDRFYETPQYLTYSLIDLEFTYYQWLYVEFI